MKKTILLAGFAIILMACKDSKNKEEKNEVGTGNAQVQEQKSEDIASALDWEKIPALNSIGDFPFITAPEGIDIYDFPENGQPKDGITALFPFKKFEVYDGKNVQSVEGKLAVIYFMEDKSNGFKYDQYIFDRNIPDYFNKMGAKLIYKGNFPEQEELRNRLHENMYAGTYGSYGLNDDSPFYVYAFKNGNKKYIANIQSNSAQGTVFIVELKDFEPTMKQYQASEIQKELHASGKAVLHINFDTDKATLKPDGSQVVSEIAKALESDKNLKISINGYTDGSGDKAHNLKLSEERAGTVKSELVKAGIEAQRLSSKGFGQDNPISDNTTEEGKALNRRVELVKIK